MAHGDAILDPMIVLSYSFCAFHFAGTGGYLATDFVVVNDWCGLELGVAEIFQRLADAFGQLMRIRWE